MNNHIQRVAHRGGSHLAPENTLAAFRHALTLPVDAIELDVHMSRDGYVVVFHDNTLERCTNGKGNLLDYDLADLRTLNAAANFPGGWPQPQQIPTLCEVLDLVKGHVEVYIEIKRSKRDGVYGFYPGIVEAVLNDIRTANLLDQVLVISFGWPMLQLLKSLEPRLQTGALVSDEQWNAYSDSKNIFETIIEGAKVSSCDWINMVHHLYTDDMPKVAHKHGFKQGVWTVNTKSELLCLAAQEVDSLTSDRPDLFAYL